MTTSSPGMPPDVEVTTVLAADIGLTRTKVALFEKKADGRWGARGVAQALSTTQSPREGILGGIVTAVHELEKAVGQLSEPGALLMGREPRFKVDAVIVSGSAAPSLRLMCLSSTARHAGLWARAASQWSYVEVVDSAALDGGEDSFHGRRWADATHPKGRSDVEMQLRLLDPDAVLVSGGYDGGAIQPLHEIAMLLSKNRPTHRAGPTVVYAGNSLAAPRIAETLTGRVELRVVDNLLPAPDTPHLEPVGEALDELYCQRKLAALNGYAVLSRMCAAPILSSARALALAWRVLAEAENAPLLGLDMGAHATVAGIVMPQGPYRLRVLTDLGLNSGWDDERYAVDAQAIVRWMPMMLSRADVLNRLASRHERMLAIAQSDDQILFQEALTCEAWRMALRPGWGDPIELPLPTRSPVHLVASGGIVVHGPSLWRIALTVLNAVEPEGLVHLWIDRAGLLAQVGALSALSRDAARSLLQSDALCHLGLAVCLAGRASQGGKAIEVELRLADGTIRRTIAAWGSISVVHTDGSRQVTAILRLQGGIYVPGREGERVLTLTLENAALGLILDCRGRPLTAQVHSDQASARVRTWLAASDQ